MSRLCAVLEQSSPNPLTHPSHPPLPTRHPDHPACARAPHCRVKDICIQQGQRWSSSVARTVMGEHEYYEALVAKYREWGRVRCR